MELETIIYYALQVKAWHLLVTKTFSETFIADLLLLKEIGAQTWQFTFFLILPCLLSIRDTHWRNGMSTKVSTENQLTRHFCKFTLTSLIVLSGRHYANGKSGLVENKEMSMDIMYQICTFVARNFMLENLIWTASCTIIFITWHTAKALDCDSDAKSNFWTLDDWKLGLWTLRLWTLECFRLWALGFLGKWILGNLNTLILNVWTYGGNICVRGLFYAFFRLYPTSVKVCVQGKYLFSRNSQPF